MLEQEERAKQRTKQIAPFPESSARRRAPDSFGGVTDAAIRGFPLGQSEAPPLSGAYTPWDDNAIADGLEANSAPHRAIPANATALGAIARPLVQYGRLAIRPGMRMAAGAVPLPTPMPIPLPLPPVAIPGTKENDEFVRQGQQLYDWLRGVLQRSLSGRGGGDPERKDECYDRWQAERGRCGGWPKQWRGGCKERARNRFQLCVGNGGRPRPDEPPEWGEGDMETWYNPDR
jgi:hypothetical protein